MARSVPQPRPALDGPQNDVSGALLVRSASPTPALLGRRPRPSRPQAPPPSATGLATFGHRPRSRPPYPYRADRIPHPFAHPWGRRGSGGVIRVRGVGAWHPCVCVYRSRRGSRRTTPLPSATPSLGPPIPSSSPLPSLSHSFPPPLQPILHQPTLANSTGYLDLSALFSATMPRGVALIWEAREHAGKRRTGDAAISQKGGMEEDSEEGVGGEGS